jgi:hypothetical protein
MDIRFGDHASFHRAAIGMTASSALLGIVIHPLTPLELGRGASVAANSSTSEFHS